MGFPEVQIFPTIEMRPSCPLLQSELNDDEVQLYEKLWLAKYQQWWSASVLKNPK